MRARGMPYNRMIPKSGYRFSDKIMRKRQSNTPLSTIASRLNRRWDRFFGSIMLGARKTNKRKQNAARRIFPSMSRISGCGAHLNAARSPDGVPPRYLLQRANAATQLQNALPGTWLPAGVIRRPLSQSSDKVAGRS